ncbi:MAG: ComEC/Rec2 family competence protein [Clostridiales Family XIII bacterium]|jgi:competence protein ComEC|nr:ComEC/Rec2 family competence protein [Clostridiales Family XIII bacterium]
METLAPKTCHALPRRPFVFAASAYIFGIAACYLFAPPAPFLTFAIAAALAGAVLFLLAGKKRAAFVCFLGVIALAGALQAHAAFAKTDGLENQMTDSDGGGYVSGFEGRVLSFEQKDEESFALTLLADERKVLVRYYGKENTLPPRETFVGARARVSGKLSVPDTARNPRCFDYRLFLLSKNIRVIVTADAPPAVIESSAASPGEPLWKAYNLIYRAKRIFTGEVRRVLGGEGETAAIFVGMMFGETELMDDETYDLFKRTGAAHILSVSGLHVGMLYAFVSAALGRRRNKRFYLTVIALLVLYAALSNFSPTVMRAVSMIAVHIGAKLLNRRYDMLTGVFLSAAACLAANPLALFGTGFILSYTAAASLAFGLPFAARYTGFRSRITGRPVRRGLLTDIYRVRGWRLIAADALALLIPMIVIQALMLPLTAFFFNLVPLTALPVNIPVIALSSLIVPLGIIVLLLSCIASIFVFLGSAFAPFAGIFSDLAGVMTQSAGWLIDVMMKFTQAAAAVPGGSPAVASPPLPLILLFYALVFFLMSDAFAIMRRGPEGMQFPKRFFAIAALVFCCLLVFASPVSRIADAPYTFVDVGQGDCLHIRTAGGHNWLMDGGGRFDYDVGAGVLLPYLQKNGVTQLDGIFVSHLHMDHFKGLCELSRVMDVGRVYVYEGHSARPEDVTEAFLENTGTDNSITKTFSENSNTGNARNNLIMNGFTEDDIVWLKAGDVVSLGGDATAEVLFPEGRNAEEYEIASQFEEDENKTSLIIRFSNDGLTALMTGDVGFEAEKAVLAAGGSSGGAVNADLPPRNLSADLLKIGHHGSKTSTSEVFLSAVDPLAAVIQVGKNNYGHPTPETLSRIADAAVPVFRNDQSGAILAKPAGDGVRILTTKRDFVSPMLRKPYE